MSNPICEKCESKLRLVSLDEHIKELLKNETDEEAINMKHFIAPVSYGDGYFICDNGHKSRYYETIMRSMFNE